MIDANPEYALIRYPNGRESTVSVKHLAPTGDLSLTKDLQNHTSSFEIISPLSLPASTDPNISKTDLEPLQQNILDDSLSNETNQDTNLQEIASNTNSQAVQNLDNRVRQSSRKHDQPTYLKDYI